MTKFYCIGHTVNGEVVVKEVMAKDAKDAKRIALLSTYIVGAVTPYDDSVAWFVDQEKKLISWLARPAAK